jgi:hypothetical protein
MSPKQERIFRFLVALAFLTLLYSPHGNIIAQAGPSMSNAWPNGWHINPCTTLGIIQGGLAIGGAILTVSGAGAIIGGMMGGMAGMIFLIRLGGC